ncbi:MAG: hypothetical protein HY854_12980 [Burkholderiales bacterium]|nr:hypothetical protein [Burkholderiales bacterium]
MKAPFVFGMLLATCALCAAKSPAEEFEEKMGRPKPPDFMLPAAADSQKDPKSAVHIMNIRSTRPEQRTPGENEHLVHEKRRSENQELRNPPTHPPAPKQMVCEGSPIPVCSMR